MKTLITYLFISMLPFSILRGQDLLVKKDSTKLQANIIEVNPTEVKYKLYNYNDGPFIRINKSEIAYVIYRNGVSERFALTQIQTAAIAQQFNGYTILTPEQKDKRCEKLYVNENYIGLSYIAILNNCIGFNYIRDFKKVNLMLNIPFAIGIGKPDITNSLYGSSFYGYGSKLTYNSIKYQIGINPLFSPNMKREVNFLIGPSFNYTAFDATAEVSYYDYDQSTGIGKMETISNSFEIQRKHYGLTVGLMARITEKFNMNMLFTIGSKIDSYDKKDPFLTEKTGNRALSSNAPYVNLLWSIGYRFNTKF